MAWKKTQMREISAQSGYCGQNSLYAHFGLADAVVVKEVRVQFSCSSETVLTNVPVNQLIEITEENTTPVREIFPIENLVLKISPNPAGDQFTVIINSIEQLKSVALNLIDTTGRICWENNLNNIPIGIFEKTFYPKNIGLNIGTYILKIISDGFVISEILVVY